MCRIRQWRGETGCRALLRPLRQRVDLVGHCHGAQRRRRAGQPARAYTGPVGLLNSAPADATMWRAARRVLSLLLVAPYVLTAHVFEPWRAKTDEEIRHAANCAARASTRADVSLTHEDVELLPLVLGAVPEGRRGRFLEIGGATGIMGSQTYMLETCFSWDGFLVEAHPEAFAKMSRSNRTAHMVHAAGCSEGQNVTVQMGIKSTGSNSITSLVDQARLDILKKHKILEHDGSQHAVQVPCRELQSIVRQLGWEEDGIDLASVDVQGAEDKVLETLDLKKTKVVIVEAEAVDQAKNKRVHAMMAKAGLVRLPLKQKHRAGLAAFNELYAQPSVIDYRPWYHGGAAEQAHHAQWSSKLQVAMDGLRGGLAGRCNATTSAHCV